MVCRCGYTGDSVGSHVKVAVGSTNPVKVAATAAVLRRIYGDDIDVDTVAVESGISHQPWGHAETLRGAMTANPFLKLCRYY